MSGMMLDLIIFAMVAVIIVLTIAVLDHTDNQ